MAEATSVHRRRRRPLERVYRESTNPEDWQWYSNRRWRRLRASLLLQKPRCADPFKEHTSRRELVMAQEVHHIKPRREFPLLAFDINNLEGLCRRCHRRVTRLEQIRRTGKFAAEGAQEAPGAGQAGSDRGRVEADSAEKIGKIAEGGGAKS